MTLAPARPAATGPVHPTGAVAPVVTAVVPTRTDPAGLAAVLEAALAQTHLPDAVLVLDRTGGSPDPATGETVEALVERVRDGRPVPVTVRPTKARVPVRRASYLALRDIDPVPAASADTAAGAPTGATAAGGTALAWFLPVGAVPERRALGALLDAWRRSPSTGLVGPKHVDADDPTRLRALAIRATRGGRLLAHPAPGEPDQGQYDRTSDVLAVPFAGSLVERDLLLGLRGWESAFGDVGADLDLGWRAQAAGRRVVAVPGARVRSARGVAPASASSAARRRAGRRVALARAPWWSTPALAAWIAVTSVLTALGLLLLKRPRAAAAELSALTSVDPVRGLRARWRTRHERSVRRRDLRSLFEPRRAVLTQWADAVHHAVIPPAPPAGEEANDLNPRSWLVKVLGHPGVLAVVGAALVAGLAARSLGLGVWTGLGGGLRGGELVGGRTDAGALWHAWVDGWTGAGLGGPDPVGPAAVLLAAPAWLVAHLPLAPTPASPAGFVVALLLVLGMPLAAASAYNALRVVVPGRWSRALGALTWATSGVAAAAVAQGRLGVVVALVLLPAVGAGLWLVGTRRSTATSAFATALAATVLGAFAPVLLAPVAVAALVLALVRRRVRTHALAVVLVPGLLLAPWLVPAATTSWPVVVAGTGLAQWGGDPLPAWRTALLDVPGAGAPVWWASVPLVVVALLALGRSRGWRTASTTLTLLVPVLLAAALAAPSVRLGTVPAGLDDAGAPITLWSGTFLLPLVLVLVVALTRLVHGRTLRGVARPVAVPAWVLAVLAVGAPAVVAGAVVVGTFGTALSAYADPRPVVAVDQSSGAFATRTLFVTPGAQGAGYRFVGREAADLVRPLPSVSAADGALADEVTGLLSAGTADVVAATATDLLAVRAGSVPDEVLQRLDAVDGLQRISSRDGWLLWRVSPQGRRGDALVASPRLRLETPADTRLVETEGYHGATTALLDVPARSRLVVAEAPGWAEHAVVTVDGTVVPVDTEATSPTYVLPTGRHELVVTVPDPDAWWHAGQVLGLVFLCFLAVPFGRRESRVGVER